jgi:hypothetical protein
MKRLERGGFDMAKTKSKSFWSYQSEKPTPRVEHLPEGTFKGNQDDWERLSPGMRREIHRQAMRKAGRVWT